MIARWLDFISSLSIFFPLVIAVLNFRILNNELKVFAIFLCFAGAVEIITYVMSLYRMNNLWMMNIYALLEGVVFIWLIGKWLGSKKMNVITNGLLVIYIAYWCYTTFLPGDLMAFNSDELSIKAIILIILSGYLLVRLGLKEEVKLTGDFIFWISAGILIYFLISLVVFSSANIILDDSHRAMYFTWTIHSIINILVNLLFFYAFICYRKTNLYSSS